MTKPDARRAPVRSIGQRVLLKAMSALAAGTALLAGGSWFVLTHELDEVFEDNLRQVALAVASHHGTRLPQTGLRRSEPLPQVMREYGNFGFATAAWTRDGVPIHQSGESAGIPFLTRSGLSEISIGGEKWHLYTIVLDDGIVQAAQRGQVRKKLARETTTAVLLPAFLLLMVLALLLQAALRRGLETLTDAAGEITSRSVASLHAIDLAAHPRELHPLIGAINELMHRLGGALTLQRHFLADAAHELRSPVTALLLQLNLLERAGNADERRAAIGELRSGVTRAQRLIEQLLQLSRLAPETPALRREPVSLAELARETVGRFSANADHRQIDLGAVAEGVVNVLGDGEQLRILLSNLVDNALRHTPHGGRVDVAAATDGVHCWLTVTDSGPGIAEADQQKVFERFYRVEHLPGLQTDEGVAQVPHADSNNGNGNGNGSGLGLAIVREVADRHGARITLGSGSDGTGLAVSVKFEAA